MERSVRGIKGGRMKFISRGLKALTFFGLVLVNAQTALFAETRLFVPDYRFGAGVDTQLVVSNTSDQDASVDLWAFVKTGELLGQEQLQIKAHGTRSLTLSEAFGPRPSQNTGWLA